jgi:hypothetical protein
MSLTQALADARERYATALDALHHQELVLQQLEELLADRAGPKLLLSDRMCQTDPDDGFSTSTFLRTAELRARILRTSSRRKVFSTTAAVEIDELALSVSALKLEAADVTPSDVVVHTILGR